MVETLAFMRGKFGETAAGFAAISQAVFFAASFSRLPDDS